MRIDRDDVPQRVIPDGSRRVSYPSPKEKTFVN